MSRVAHGVGLALLLLPPFAMAQEEKDLERLVGQLCDETNASMRAEAYQALLRDRSPALVQLLETHLPKAPLQSQQLGIYLLQGHPREVSHPVLVRLSKAGGPYLRLAAAAILLRSGDGSVVPSIVQALQDRNATMQMLTMMPVHLYGIRDPAVLAALRGLVRLDVDASIVDGALYQLIQAKDEATATHLKALLDGGQGPASLRASLAAALLGMGDSGFVSLVVDEVKARGTVAVNRLHRYLVHAPRLSPELLEAIGATLDTETSGIPSVNALGLLGQHGSGKEVALVRRFVEHQTPYVAKAALQALQKMTGGLPKNELVTLLESKDPNTVLVAADSLRRMDDRSGLGQVVTLSKTPGAVRAEAIRILAGFRHRDAIDPMIDALEDKDLNVRLAAAQGLGTTLHTLFPYRRFDLASAGYDPDASEAMRQTAVVKIRAWWVRQRP